MFSDTEHMQQPDIYLRTYETSKERCDRVEQEHATNTLEMDRFNEKLRGPLHVMKSMRTQVKTMEKHLPIRTTQETDEGARISRAVAEINGKSLCEGFDTLLYLEPIYKPIQKHKWRTPRGMSYSG